jgi:hypothetical protein
MRRASFAFEIPRRRTNPMLLFPSATRPSEEKGVSRKAWGEAYMKSEKDIRAAERPIAGPFRAVMRILGWV